MFPKIIALILLTTSINCQDYSQNNEKTISNPLISENTEVTESPVESNGRFLGHLLGFDREQTQTVHHHHHNENHQKPVVLAPSIPVVHPQSVIPVVGHPIPVIQKPIIQYHQPHQFIYYPGYYPFEYTRGYPGYGY